MTSNLPAWPGASKVYSKAYRVLERMSRNTKVNYHRGRYICDGPSDDMQALIDALNEGDEERIKGLLLMSHIYPVT